MEAVARYILFVSVVIAALWLLETATGQPLFDDASARITHLSQ